MKKSNKFIALMLVVLSMFILFSGSLSVSAEVAESTTVAGETECTERESCTCQKHQDMLTTTEPSTEPGFSLGEEDMSKLGELGGELKGVAKIFHNFFDKFNQILNAILKLADNFSDGLPLIGKIF